ncbi:MAG: Flp pilus assembly complex ATPase component TadA [Candidatus Aenigmarchaeota archaeon]|nr:Flp pilus assembly complex ATPase component TadA [Candidatus Aenigmarchaeota archaeon]
MFSLRGALRGTGKHKEAPRYPMVFLKEPQKFAVIPTFENATKIDVRYPLLEPFVHAHIKWEPKDKKLVYYILEPKLQKGDEEVIKKLEEDLIELIDVKLTLIKERYKAMEYLQEKVQQVLLENEMALPQEQYARIMYYIIRDFVGLNEIEPLLHDPYIEDIGCTGLNTAIYIVHRRFGSVETNVVYNDPDYLSNFVVKIAERCGRYISYATPLLDGSLPDGSRVQASLAKDVTTKGPTFSIRKFRKNPYSPLDLINLNTANFGMMAYLWLLMQYKTSILICGGVATGKTTFLNSLSMFIQPEEKIISIEDTREINLPHENWIPAVSRVGFGVPEAGGKRYGEISLFDLLKESFRQNPNYVIVGEVRGKEAYVLFQGMASGHASIGTMHAGSVDDVVKRLETPPIELSPSLIESLDVIVVMTNARERGESSRRVKEIAEIQSVDSRTGVPHINKVFVWMPSVDDFKETVGESEVLRRISFREGIAYMKLTEEVQRRRRILEWLHKHNVYSYDEFSKLVNLYYKDPDTVMRWIEKGLPPYSTKSQGYVDRIWSKAKRKIVLTDRAALPQEEEPKETEAIKESVPPKEEQPIDEEPVKYRPPKEPSAYGIRKTPGVESPEEKLESASSKQAAKGKRRKQTAKHGKTRKTEKKHLMKSPERPSGQSGERAAPQEAGRGRALLKRKRTTKSTAKAEAGKKRKKARPMAASKEASTS